MGRYIIKVWETEEERDLGESNIVETNLNDIEQAIGKAKKIMNNQNYASLEVQNSNENETYYFVDSTEEKHFQENIEKAKVQERVNIYAIAVGKKEIFASETYMYGKVEDIITKLKENQEYINDPKNDVDEENREYINEETEGLIKDLEEKHDSKDFIELVEHPMVGFYVEKNISETLEDLQKEYMQKITEGNLKDICIKNVIATYYEMKGIYNLSEYRDDENKESSPSFSELYNDICKYLGIETQSIITDEERPGKYQTIITFQNGNSKAIISKGNYLIHDIAENINIIRNSYTMEPEQLDNDMEME